MQGPWIRHPFLARGARPLFVAHRGGSLEWPECSPAAFAGAVALGAEVLELDVHYTADGAIVVHHDAELDRTTEASGLVVAHTLAELRALDIGARFAGDDGDFPWRGRGQCMMTLEEFLAAFPDVRLNIDVKDNDLALADEVVALLRAHGRASTTCLASFHEPVCRHLARIAPEFCLCCSPLTTLALILSHGRAPHAGEVAGHVLEVPVEYGPFEVITAARVEAYHRAGFAVHVWTVDDEPTMRWLVDIGVDGIMTDRPSVLGRVLGVGPGRAPGSRPGVGQGSTAAVT